MLTARSLVLVAGVLIAVTITACRSGTSDKPSVTPTEPSVVASPSPDPAALATRAAGSAAAKLGPVVIDVADYPPGFEVKRQLTKIVAASDVPGLPSEGSAFFATAATPAGDEFVNVVAVAAATEADAKAAFQAFSPATYLPGLTGGASDATSKPESVVGAPAGASAFSFTGTVTANEGGALKQHAVSGTALAFVRGTTMVVVIGAEYDSAPKTADVGHIAAAIDARLAAAAG